MAPTITPDDDDWKAQANRLEAELNKFGFKNTQNIEDVNSFNAILQNRFSKYSETPKDRCVRSLNSHFEHITSFSKAIGAATQADTIAASVWSASLAVMECTCRHVRYIEETLDNLESFQESFTIFDAYINLFPGSRLLQLDLKDLYTTYTNFCLLTIRYMRKGPIAHVATNLFSSSSRRSLDSLLKKWNSQKSTFDAHVNLTYRQKTLAPGQSVGVSGTPARANSPVALPQAVGIVPVPPTIASSNTVNRTSNMPRLQRHITGREEFLEDLHKTLTSSASQAPHEPSSCLIHAMGGMGKTQTALTYSFRFQHCYDYRWWIRADTPEGLADSFSSIAEILGMKKADVNLFGAVKEWMETTDKTWLAIFDNVEKDTLNQVEDLLPVQTSSKGISAIILTSQIEEHKQIVQHSIPLKSFSAEDSINVLIRCLHRDKKPISDDEQKVLEEVAYLLGGLPLAIAHVGGYISQSKQSLHSFRDHFKTQQEKIWSEDSVLATKHYKSLEIIWNLALEELSPNARRLIHIMAYLNPDVIPEKWLEQDIATNSDWGIDSKSELWDMPRSLSKRCLVDVVHEDGTDQTVYSIHRSLQVALRLKMDKDVRSRSLAFNHALSIVSRASPRASKLQTPDAAKWPAFQKSNPHALSLCNAFRDSKKKNKQLPPSLELAEVLYNAGFHVWETWNPITQDGILLLETAEEVLDLIKTDKNDRLRADIICMKSGLFDIVGLGKRAESFTGRQIVCNIRQNILKSQPADQEASKPSEREHLYYNSLNDLALSYLQNDQFLDAERIFNQCFTKYQQWGTSETIPFEYGKYYHNIAFVRMYQGRYKEALETMNRGVSIKEKTDGKDSSRYWWWQYDVGCIMLQAGQLNEALKLHHEVLKNRIRVCGASQEVTLQSLYTVGAIYFHLKMFAEAESYFRDCIKTAKKVQWHDGALGRAKWHLAEVLEIQNKEKQYVGSLRQEAQDALDDIYKRSGDTPVYVKNADTMVRYDWTQPAFDGRWTGLDLLPLVQNNYELLQDVGNSSST